MFVKGGEIMEIMKISLCFGAHVNQQLKLLTMIVSNLFLIYMKRITLHCYFKREYIIFKSAGVKLLPLKVQHYGCVIFFQLPAQLLESFVCVCVD